MTGPSDDLPIGLTGTFVVRCTNEDCEGEQEDVVTYLDGEVFSGNDVCDTCHKIMECQDQLPFTNLEDDDD